MLIHMCHGVDMLIHVYVCTYVHTFIIPDTHTQVTAPPSLRDTPSAPFSLLPVLLLTLTPHMHSDIHTWEGGGGRHGRAARAHSVTFAFIRMVK